jgi:hypothetical protein
MSLKKRVAAAVDWLCTVGTFDCRRQDCRKVSGEDCRKCGMPDLKAKTGWLITLRQRCERYRCLPYPGGLLEQPAWLMRLFDVMDARREHHRREQAENGRRQAERDRLRAELKNGR